MDDNRKLAEEVWDKLWDAMWEAQDEKGDGYWVGAPIIAAYGDARYKAGVEAMRNAAFEPFSSYEYVGRMTLWHHLQDAARLLEAK